DPGPGQGLRGRAPAVRPERPPRMVRLRGDPAPMSTPTSAPTGPELEALRAFAVEVAREAGALQMEGLARPQAVELKSWRELVTPIDRACEELIHARVRAAW